MVDGKVDTSSVIRNEDRFMRTVSMTHSEQGWTGGLFPVQSC